MIGSDYAFGILIDKKKLGSLPGDIAIRSFTLVIAISLYRDILILLFALRKNIACSPSSFILLSPVIF